MEKKTEEKLIHLVSVFISDFQVFILLFAIMLITLIVICAKL